MSTRCVVNFCYKPARGRTGKVAKIYKHMDGYPIGSAGMLEGFNIFFNAVERDTRDTRFNDPAYLAAKYVVWLAQHYAENQLRPLNFISVGILKKDPGDIEHSYDIICSDNSNNRPQVVHYSNEIPF